MTITVTSRKRETEHSGRSKGTKDKNPRKMHPNSLHNLKPFENGHPPLGNATPGKGYSLTSALKVSLGKPLKQPTEDAPARDHIVYATLKGAIACEPTSAHLKEVWDRVEGKVPEKHAIIGDIVLRIVDDDDRDQGTDNTPQKY